MVARVVPIPIESLSGVLKVLSLVTVGLCVADGALTLHWLETGQATEYNPIMAALLDVGPAVFMVAKMTLLAGGLYLLWRHRDRLLSVVGIFMAFAIYVSLTAYHLGYIHSEL